MKSSTARQFSYGSACLALLLAAALAAPAAAKPVKKKAAARPAAEAVVAAPVAIAAPSYSILSRHTVETAGTYPVAEIGKHTAEAYGDVKARIAAHYLDLSRRSPRWLEDWQVRGSTKTLQIDENDLWLVAQAVERNRRLVTTDGRLADRFVPAIAELRIDVI